MRISDWSSDVCSSDLGGGEPHPRPARPRARFRPAVAARRDGETLARRTLLARLCAHHRPAHGRLFRADPVLLLYPEMDSEDRRRYGVRSEEHTSELQSLMRISYAVFCLQHTK